MTDYAEINKIKKLFIPYNKVWTIGRDYNFKILSALSGPLTGINRDEFTNDVIESWNELYKLEKTTFKIV